MNEEANRLPWRMRLLGAAFVATAAFLNYRIMGPATNLLSAGLVVAYFLWAFGRWTNDPAILRLYLIGIAVQCMHLVEEYLTGFPQEFPALFGYHWSNQRFLVFNLLWLTLFVVAAFGIWGRSALAYLIVLFFAIAGELGNGIGHLALSLAQRRYFPGTVTAPLALVVGVALLSKLLRTTEQPDEAG